MKSGDLAISWLALREKGRPLPGDFRVFDLPVGSNLPQMLVATDFDRYRHFLVRNREDDNFEELGGTGVRLLKRDLKDGGSTYRYADVVCLRPDLNDLFDVLILEISDALEKESRNAGSTCGRVLERWRELLAQESGAKLGIDALTGLFGELHFLGRLLRLNPEADSLWFGPESQRHDFATAGCALEIKTSRSRYGRFCQIHGQDQLSAPPDTDLYLAYVRVETPVPDGASVPDLVDEVLKLTSRKLRIIEKLNALGYDLGSTDDYRQHRFRITEDLMYRIDDSFPRIVSSSFVTGSIPPGVTSLIYEIDLSGEPPWPVSRDRADRILAEIAGTKSDV